MATSDWNWRLPPELQDVPWDCAAASLTWCLNTIGFVISESEVVEGLGPSRISPTYGLLDASGAGLVSYLGELGISAANNPSASWLDVWGAAGFQPMLIGGRAWYHWTGVRMSSAAAPGAPDDVLALANPAPGWMGVSQALWSSHFARLGIFSAVWFVSW